jgi:FlgD Ig-like domain
MRYINGTDPSNPTQAYNYMRGLQMDGLPLIDPTTSEITTFYAPGDPVTGTGWLDQNPADRRFMITSGPFTMAPGDSQQVVYAFAIGQGTDRLNSITVLRDYVIGTDYPTPVLIQSFSGERTEEGIVVRWRVTESARQAYFHLYRAEPGQERAQITEEPLGGRTVYEYIDRDAPAGDVEYWLCPLGMGGIVDWCGPLSIGPGLPGRTGLSLSLISRNPVRSQATLRFEIPARAAVRLTIHDPGGRLLKTLVDRPLGPGVNLSNWDGTDDRGGAVAVGIYWARLEAAGRDRSVKFVYLP